MQERVSGRKLSLTLLIELIEAKEGTTILTRSGRSFWCVESAVRPGFLLTNEGVMITGHGWFGGWKPKTIGDADFFKLNTQSTGRRSRSPR